MNEPLSRKEGIPLTPLRFVNAQSEEPMLTEGVSIDASGMPLTLQSAGGPPAVTSTASPVRPASTSTPAP